MTLSYVNFSGGNAFITVETVIWAVVAGLFVGCIASLYSKVYLGRIVRALLKKEALGKEKAVPFADLGIRKAPLVKRALRDSSALRKHVYIENKSEAALPVKSAPALRKIRKFFKGSEESDTRYDLDAVRLYIPEDKKYSAEVKYESRGNPVLLIPIALIFFAAVFALLYFGMPKLLEMLDSVISTFKNL